MKPEIKPGCLCVIIRCEHPTEANGRIVEVLEPDVEVSQEYGRRFWRCKSSAPVPAIGGTSSTHITVRETCLLPISDPDLDVSETTTRSLTHAN